MTYPLVKFGDVVRQVKDKVDPQTAGLERFVAGEHMDTDNLHIRRWGDVGAGYLGPAFHMRFKPGQVLYGSRRTYLRKVAVAEFEGITANTTYVIESKDPDVLLPELLPFIMQTDSFNEHSIKQSKGSVNPYINFSDITWYEFPLPPIDEQRRIANLLWATDDTLQEYHRLKQENKKLRDSARKHLFTFGTKNTLTKDSKIGNLPSNWDVKKLGEAFDFLDNKRIPLKDSDRNKRQGEYPYYGAAGIIDYIDGYIFDETTLLLEEDGMNLIFRSSPVIYKATGKYWVNNHAHVLRPYENTNMDFYLDYLEYISYEPYVTGTYQKKITKSDCMAIPVIYPPLDEQKEIAEKFNEIRQAEISISNHIETVKILKKEILTGVFS